jgi:serine protease Do
MWGTRMIIKATLFSFLALVCAHTYSADSSEQFSAIKALIDERALEHALREMKSQTESKQLDDAGLAILSGMFLAESGQPGKALKIIETAEFSTTQYGSEIAEAKARAYFKQGALSRADEFAAVALKEDPSNRSARLITLKVAGELSSSLQEQDLEKLLTASNNDRAVWLTYLDQALRFAPHRSDLADRAYVELGDTGVTTEYRGRFKFQNNARYEAFSLFQEAKQRYEREGNIIAQNRISRWLKLHNKYAKRPVAPKPTPQRIPAPKPNPPELKRENLVVPKLTPASQSIEQDIDPIDIETTGDVFTGSGFVTNNGKWVITNRHVIENSDRLIVRNGLGKVRHVTKYILDENQDIALLYLDRPYPAHQSVQYQDIIDPVGGDELFLMGYPLAGLLGAHHPSITEGIVSKEAGFGNKTTEFLVTANLNQGNSGGPIFSVDGRVLGIAVAKLDKSKYQQENQFIPEDVNIGIKGREIRRFMDIQGLPSTDSRPVLSPRDAYSQLRARVVLIVAIDD